MTTATRRRRPLLVPTLVLGVASIGLSALGWGSLRGLFANPARAAGLVVMLVLTVAVALSEVNLSLGTRTGSHGGWVVPVAMIVGPLTAVVAPYMDRHEIWVLDGDALRWSGVAATVVGGVLRVWPMFVLGRRFSAFVAIQEEHALVTDGVYAVVRHPSYLGGLIAFVGWVLVFRSAIGLALAAVLVVATIARIRDEERLLASHFGAPYEAYRARTWRLVPFLY